MASLREEKEKVTNGLKCCEGDIWANCRDELMMDALILLQEITKYG